MIILEPNAYKERNWQNYSGEEIELDGIRFFRCNFDRCTFIFRGLHPFVFTECTGIDTCQMALKNDAKAVFSFIALAFSPGKIAKMAEDLRSELINSED